MAAERRRSKSSRATPPTLGAEIIRRSARSRSRDLVTRSTKSEKGGTRELRALQLMTPREVQQKLRVSESWLKRSDIPSLKLVRLRRYDAAVVDAYVAARCPNA